MVSANLFVYLTMAFLIQDSSIAEDTVKKWRSEDVQKRESATTEIFKNLEELTKDDLS